MLTAQIASCVQSNLIVKTFVFLSSSCSLVNSFYSHWFLFNELYTCNNLINFVLQSLIKSSYDKFVASFTVSNEFRTKISSVSHLIRHSHLLLYEPLHYRIIGQKVAQKSKYNQNITKQSSYTFN